MIDQEKSGKYIAEKRKQLGLTQKDLAERVGLTDKAVSKWECGRSIPDSSVLGELCNILNISFNEYLSGEDIAEEHYSDRAEENMRELITEKRAQKNHSFLTVGFLLFGFLLTVIGMYGICLIPHHGFASFIDIPNFVLLIGITLLGLIASGNLADFVKAFQVFSRKTVFSDIQISRSFYAVRAAMLLNPGVGVFLSVGQLILLLNGGSDERTIRVLTGLALLPLWYGILFDLIAVPLISRLHRLKN